MTDTKSAAEAHVLACRRLWTHLEKVAELADLGNIPAARLVLDDATSDLDDIQQLLGTLEGEPADTGSLPNRPTED